MSFVEKKYDFAFAQLKKEKAHWILHKSNEAYNVAFIGSSRVFNTISPVLIDTVLKIKSVNLGVGGAAFAENYLLLEQFLRKNAIETLYIQVDLWGLILPKEAYNHSFSEEKYLNLIGSPSVDSIYLSNSNPLKFYFRKYIPFFKYSEYNSIYSVDKMLLGLNPDNKNIFDKTKGATILEQKKDGITFKNLIVGKVKNANYCLESALSLKKLIAYAQSKKIKVSLFTAPSYIPYMKSLEFNLASKDTIKKIAKEFNVPFFDFEKSNHFKDTLLFRDYTHLNKKGSIVFSKLLSDTIKKYNYGKN